MQITTVPDLNDLDSMKFKAKTIQHVTNIHDRSTKL